MMALPMKGMNCWSYENALAYIPWVVALCQSQFSTYSLHTVLNMSLAQISQDFMYLPNRKYERTPFKN